MEARGSGVVECKISRNTLLQDKGEGNVEIAKLTNIGSCFQRRRYLRFEDCKVRQSLSSAQDCIRISSLTVTAFAGMMTSIPHQLMYRSSLKV